MARTVVVCQFRAGPGLLPGGLKYGVGDFYRG